jgi:cardiolipin synthase A/B
MRSLLPHDLELTYVIIEWMIRIAMLIVVPRMRTPQAAQSWLLLIFFLPIPGLLLYLMIGRPSFPHWRHERFQHFQPFLNQLQQELARFADGPQVDQAAAALITKVGGFPPTHGNTIEFISDYEEAVDRLVADIDQARHHVRLLVYIFADDETGRKVIDALARAVKRGVECHVLIDALGSRQWIARTIRLLEAAGVNVRKALPLRLLRERTRRDMRNHRKLFLIDGEIGYAGSQNLVNKDFRPGITNRELVVRMTGPIVTAMAGIFLMDWYLECEQIVGDLDEPHVAPNGTCIAQILPSGADYPSEGFETLLVWKLHQAQQRVVLTTPYLIPDEGLLGAMRTSVLRGVQVDVIVSKVVDQRLVSLAQRSFYDDLLCAGIRIHHYRNCLLHAKNVTIDGALAIVGSSNADVRSFQLNEEVSIVLMDKSSVDQVEAVQRDYLSNSDPMTLEEWRKRPTYQLVLERVARLVSPLL